MSWAVKRGWVCVLCGQQLKRGMPAWVRESFRPSARIALDGTVTRRWRERIVRFWCLRCGARR